MYTMRHNNFGGLGVECGGGGGGGGGAISNDVLKFRRVIEFENLSITICFSNIYLIIDVKTFILI